MAVNKFMAGQLHERQVAFLRRGPWTFVGIDPPRFYQKYLSDGSQVEARLCTEHCNICGQQICDPVRVRNTTGEEAVLGIDCYETAKLNKSKAYLDAKSGLLKVKKAVTTRRKGEALAVVLAPLVAEMKQWAAVGAGKAAEVAQTALRVIGEGRRPSQALMDYIERLRAEWVDPTPVLTKHARLLADLDAKSSDSSAKDRDRSSARCLANKIREQATKGQTPTARQLQEAEDLLHRVVVAAPSGPTKIRGKVVYTDVKDNPFSRDPYGGVYKMLVIVPAEGGEYKVWSTVPRALLDAVEAQLQNNTGLLNELVGCEIEFVANLKPKLEEPDFAFADRPSKAKLLSWPKEKEKRG